MIENKGWEVLNHYGTEDPGVARWRVDGGWLYVVSFMNGGTNTVFVPDPSTPKSASKRT
jgi:hypothetical protein